MVAIVEYTEFVYNRSYTYSMHIAQCSIDQTQIANRTATTGVCHFENTTVRPSNQFYSLVQDDIDYFGWFKNGHIIYFE